MSTHEQEDVDREILQAVLDEERGLTSRFSKVQTMICRRAGGAETGHVTTRFGKIAKVKYESDRKKPK